MTSPGHCAASSGTPRRGEPAGRRVQVPAAAAATARTSGSAGRLSSSTARPPESQSGIRQFGYSSLVPGRFCARRSPTASASDTLISWAGVFAR
jgi:hypothetical protein